MVEQADILAAKEAVLRNSPLLRAREEGEQPAPQQHSGGAHAPVAFPARDGSGLSTAAPETSSGGSSAETPSGPTPAAQMVKLTLDGTPIELPIDAVERMVAEARSAKDAIARAELLREEARESIQVTEWLRKRAPETLREQVGRAMNAAAQADDEDVEEEEPDEAAPVSEPRSSGELAALRAQVRELKRESQARQQAEQRASSFQALERAMDQHAALKDPVVRELATRSILGELTVNPQADPAVVVARAAAQYGALLVKPAGTPSTVAREPAVPSPAGTRSPGSSQEHGNTARRMGDRLAAIFGKKS